MPVTDANVDDVFSYHRPTEEQLPKYEAVMTANSAIALLR